MGLLGVAEIVPLMAFGLYGGVLADRLDHSLLLRWGEAGLGALAALLLLNALLARPAVWPLYLLAAAMTALSALQRPSFDAAVPRTVPRDQLAAAAGLLGVTTNASVLLGTALGGALAAAVGPQLVHGLDTASFAVSFVLLSRLRRMPPPAAGPDGPAGPGPQEARPGVRSVLAGLDYARRRPELLGCYLADLAAMILAYPVALFPVPGRHAACAVVGRTDVRCSLRGCAGRVGGERVDQPGAPARGGDRPGRGRVGDRHHRVRVRPRRGRRAGLPARRRGR